MKFVAICLPVLLVGCSLIPKEKTSISTVTTAEKIAAQNSVAIKRVVQGSQPQPLPSVTVSGTSNRVEIAYTVPPVSKSLPPITSAYQDATSFSATTGQDSSTKLDDTATSSVTIPLGVKIAMLAGGLGLLLLVLRSLRRSSAAAASAFDLADSGMSKAIRLAHDGFGSAVRGIRDRAALSTDPKEIALMASLLAGIEADRGKAAAAMEAERGKIAKAS